MARLSSKEMTIGIIVIFVLIAGVFGFLIVKSIAKQRALNKAIKVEQDVINKLPKIDEQTKFDVERRLQNALEMEGRFKKILPNMKVEEADNLLNSISRLRQKARLESLGYQRVGGKGGASQKEVVRLQYKMQLKGSFQWFLYFLNKLETLEKFIKVDSFNIESLGGNLGMWKERKVITITLSSYYYAPPSGS